MPGNAFIKFKEVAKGESQQDGFHGDQGWIEIGDWSWDVEAESSFMKGGGASVGKPMPGALNFSHYYDVSSPTIFRNIVKGVHFEEVEVVMCKQTGSGKPEKYFRILMKSAFCTKVSTKGGEDGTVNQDVDLVFKHVYIEYYRQNNKGQLSQAGEFEWNISAMKVIK